MAQALRIMRSCYENVSELLPKPYGGGPFVLVPGPSREKHLPDSREGLPDSREGRYGNVFGYYHGHVMAMIVFMAMEIALLLPCDGYAMSAIMNIVMEMSWL